MNYSNHELNWGAETRLYGYSESHKHILRQFGKPYNIGENGENLTIMLLSQNRSASTMDLLKSIKTHIPRFAGEVLIVDNCSADEEKAVLHEFIANLPYKTRIVELDKNYGVAGGRNRGVEQVNTLWIMSVDNDMYFISNPLQDIEKTIEEFGCHFINLPFLNSSGKTIEADGGILRFEEKNGEIYVQHDSMFIGREAGHYTCFAPSIGTFLFGAGSLYRKDTFLLNGGYDEGMFVGFEDTDFSLTLFRNGYKIVNCGKVSLVHNHKKASSEADRDAERVRHDRKRLKDAGDYFKNKNNITIWDNGVNAWIERREKELGLVDNEPEEQAPSDIEDAGPRLPSIALIIDRRNWAFGNISNQIVKHLSHYYDFKRIYLAEPEYANIAKVLFAVKDCDLVHVFFRVVVNDFRTDKELAYIKKSGGNVNKFIEEYINPVKFSTAVYDHLYLTGSDFQMHTIPFTQNCCFYYTASNKLQNIYTDLYNKGVVNKPPVKVIADGVDLTLFRPQNLERLSDAVTKRPLRIGWAGNSDWVGYNDLKGIKTIIMPAVESLQNEGYNVELHILDRKNGMTPHEKMPDYYNSVDVYVCASEMEGTPNPVLESMACGVPVVSTDVGIVPDAFGKLQKDFIYERSVNGLKEKIIKLVKNPEILLKLSAENLISIKDWDWAIRVQLFKEYFDSCLNG